MRAILIIPADGSSPIEAALDGPADALLIDLAACGDARRREAREWARDALFRARARARRPLLFVKAAPVTGAAIDADLAATMAARPDGVFLEQAEGRASVQHLAAKLAVAEAEAGLAEGATRIVALATQTPAAIFSLGSYAGASERLAGLVFDQEALKGDPAAVARALLLYGAAAADAPAIEGSLWRRDDETAFLQGLRAARRDGFSAVLAGAAGQAAAIKAAFEAPPPPARD